ncbi:MAG: lysophospholipid acyltransferase family protein [Chloroflexota bacterium]|nr:lysophospholipid acyltransferase family protein [Chloroflexota bacterium]
MNKQPLLMPIRFLVRTLTKFQVIGKGNFPSQGGVLLTTNHLSRLDTPLLMAIHDRRDIVAIVAKKYQKKPFFRWILEKVCTIIWMDRDNMDFFALRQALDHLRHGAIVGVAPEGTRSRETEGLLEGKQGAALIAARASVPIIPVGIYGSEKINEQFLRLRRPPVVVRIGESYRLPEMDRNDRQAWISKYTDEIMCRIAVLLPPTYRGFYAEHPRLKELLVEISDTAE